MKKYLEIIVNPACKSLPRKLQGTKGKIKIEYGSELFREMEETCRSLPEGETAFFGWQIINDYSKEEMNGATLFQMSVTNYLDYFAVEVADIYDERCSCPVCGGGRKQVKPLQLKGKRHEKYDVVRLLSGEVVVSENVARAMTGNGLEFGRLEPVTAKGASKSYYQLLPAYRLTITENTAFGISPFDLRGSDCDEVYLCPGNDTLGLNQLSEVHVERPCSQKDFYLTRQYVGVSRGLLRPEPLWICSRKAKLFFEENGIKGVRFDIVRIE